MYNLYLVTKANDLFQPPFLAVTFDTIFLEIKSVFRILNGVVFWSPFPGSLTANLNLYLFRLPFPLPNLVDILPKFFLQTNSIYCFSGIFMVLDVFSVWTVLKPINPESQASIFCLGWIYSRLNSTKWNATGPKQVLDFPSSPTCLSWWPPFSSHITLFLVT